MENLTISTYYIYFAYILIAMRNWMLAIYHLLISEIIFLSRNTWICGMQYLKSCLVSTWQKTNWTYFAASTFIPKVKVWQWSKF